MAADSLQGREGSWDEMRQLVQGEAGKRDRMEDGQHSVDKGDLEDLEMRVQKVQNIVMEV